MLPGLVRHLGGELVSLRATLAVVGARVVVDGVARRPGRPQALAQLPDGRWVVGGPGNPYAALVALLTLLGPLLGGAEALAAVPASWAGEPVGVVGLPGPWY
ncbi:MAG TPA: hypothetical protein VFX70_18000 [Mycobacteriales bacterium]|nr:hypothetical protein [Mycobacteriales bacterium]